MKKITFRKLRSNPRMFVEEAFNEQIIVTIGDDVEFEIKPIRMGETEEKEKKEEEAELPQEAVLTWDDQTPTEAIFSQKPTEDIFPEQTSEDWADGFTNISSYFPEPLGMDLLKKRGENG